MKASEMARVLGRRGGIARSRRLRPEEKRRIASSGGEARARSLAAARRIAENLRYAAAVEDLRGRPAPVRRVETCPGPLPGIYPPRPSNG